MKFGAGYFLTIRHTEREHFFASLEKFIKKKNGMRNAVYVMIVILTAGRVRALYKNPGAMFCVTASRRRRTSSCMRA